MLDNFPHGHSMQILFPAGGNSLMSVYVCVCVQCIRWRDETHAHEENNKQDVSMKQRVLFSICLFFSCYAGIVTASVYGSCATGKQKDDRNSEGEIKVLIETETDRRAHQGEERKHVDEQTTGEEEEET